MTDYTHINDGGPAFPVPGTEYNDRYPGMSLRDWFAGQALQGLTDTYPISFLEDDSTSGHRASQICKNRAQAAYAIADAMLAAREGGAP